MNQKTMQKRLRQAWIEFMEARAGDLMRHLLASYRLDVAKPGELLQDLFKEPGYAAEMAEIRRLTEERFRNAFRASNWAFDTHAVRRHVARCMEIYDNRFLLILAVDADGEFKPTPQERAGEDRDEI